MNTTKVFAATRTAEARVTTLELFFDLVFVLAIAQCTGLMAGNPTWTGVAQGIVVLAALWWAWVGYAWLTSVINPEHVAVRLPLVGAMIGLAICAMCTPSSFTEHGTLFAAAYSVVRIGHIFLFWLASRDDPALRRSVGGLGVGTVVACTLLLVGSALEPRSQLIVWAFSLTLDLVGPFVFGSEGWKVAPGHFAERHGLIIIIALGESIIAIGVGAKDPGATGAIVAASLGTIVAAGLWWVYFDVLAFVAERALHRTREGQERNEMARDAYSYLHFPMVVGIVLLALGMKKTLGHVDYELTTVGAVALLGGASMFVISCAAFAFRTTGWISWDSVIGACAVFALLPLAPHVSAITLLIVMTTLVSMIVIYKSIRYREGRVRVRASVIGG